MITVTLFELTAAIDEDGSQQVFYFSSGPYVHSSAPGVYDTRLLAAGRFKMTALRDLRTFGGSEASAGEIVLDNADAGIDALAAYGYGFSARVLMGDAEAHYNSFIPLVEGVVEQVMPGTQDLRFRLKDRQKELDIPIQPSRFAGSNAGAAGLEGTESDIKGRVKPRYWGRVYNISPVMLNSSQLIMGFRFNRDGTRAPTNGLLNPARDGGKDLTPGTDYANYAALDASTPSAGTYNTCLAESLIMLGSKPVYGITLDAETARKTVREVTTDILLDAGIPESRINENDLGQFAVDANYICGEYVDYEANYRQLLDLIVGSGGGYYLPDGRGIYRVRQLKEPSGEPVATFKRFGPDVVTLEGDLDIENNLRPVLPADSGVGVPALRTVLRYRKNYTVQQGGALAASEVAVTAALIAKYGEEWRRDVKEFLDVALQFPLAPEIEFESRLTEAAEASTENARRYQIYGEPGRQMFEVETGLTLESAAAVRCGDVVRLEYPRYGLDDGKLFTVTELEYDRDNGVIRAILWG